MGVISRSGGTIRKREHCGAEDGRSGIDEDPKKAYKKLKTMMGNLEDTLEELQNALQIALKAADPSKLRFKNDFGRRIRVFVPHKKMKFQAKDGKGEWMEGIVLNFDDTEGIHRVMFNGDLGHELLWDLDLKSERYEWLDKSVQDSSAKIEIQSDTSSCTDGCGWSLAPEEDSSFLAIAGRAPAPPDAEQENGVSPRLKSTDSNHPLVEESDERDVLVRSKRKQTKPNRSAAE